jgi:hypothetical protein
VDLEKFVPCPTVDVKDLLVPHFLRPVLLHVGLGLVGLIMLKLEVIGNLFLPHEPVIGSGHEPSGHFGTPPGHMGPGHFEPNCVQEPSGHLL